MFSIHSFPSIPIPFFLSTTSITLTLIHIHSIPLIPFHFIIPFHFHSSILHPHSIHIVSLLLLFVSQLLDQCLVCSDTRYRMFICCVDKKHSLSIRRTCFCLWWLIREQQHRMMRKWENGYLRIGGNRCTRSWENRSRFHQMITEGYLHQSNTKSLLSRIIERV